MIEPTPDEQVRERERREAAVVEAARRTCSTFNRMLDWSDHESRRTGDILAILHTPAEIRDSYRATFDDLLVAVSSLEELTGPLPEGR